MTPAIVVVAYNRPASLLRLLSLLQSAVYDADEISLIVSIDFQDSQEHQEVVKIAKEFTWCFGSKRVIEHFTNIGLKAHILSCGDLSEEYGAVIILEDDLFISPYFYEFSKQALKVYSEDENIAGISLYGLDWSQVADMHFIPEPNGADVYFVQHSQSWGQVWSRRMWQDFREWHATHTDCSKQENLPENVKDWSSSWLKFHIWYCVDRNKFFVYPFVSLSTNFSETGQHVKFRITTYQTPLLTGKKQTYVMPQLASTACKYDVFLERQGLGIPLGIDEGDLCTDLYGRKKNKENRKYWLTSAIADYKIVKSFALELKPHELNITFDIPGSDIFLYDTHCRAKNPCKAFSVGINRTLYHMKEVPSKSLLQLLAYRLLRRLKIKRNSII